ncbi:histidine phosphatase family protein [Chitinivorax sp. PXF-14]|uniref:histidine phosphatase family protein n=1 Tax=Chitinivorax sp. PXF-14 TaxID=3230488 RepID=UPI003465BF92
MKTRLCLVRHGETDWNVARRLQGHIDVPLNDNGVKQAEATAVGLAGESFDAIYSSDLTRARQTAEAAAQRLKLPIRFRPSLRERHYGVFQGLTHVEGSKQHPEAYRRFSARELDYDIPGDGESLRRFGCRVHETLEEIAQAHPGETVLVVTHGGALHIANRVASGQPIDAARDYPIPNAALNWLSYQEGHWEIERWADLRHLDGALDEI